MKPGLPQVPIRLGASLATPVVYIAHKDKEAIASDSYNPIVPLSDTNGMDGNSWKIFTSVLTPSMDAKVHVINLVVGNRNIVREKSKMCFIFISLFSS